MRLFIYIASTAFFAACLPQHSQLLSENDRINRQHQAEIESMVLGFEGKVPVPTMSASQLQSVLHAGGQSQDHVLVDVREENERSVSIIPGAISKQDLERDLASANSQYQNKKIVSYCTIGYRSMNYTKELKEQGLDAYNLRGSILSWLHSGGEVVTPLNQQATKEVHVYGNDWMLAPVGYDMQVNQSWLSSWF
jgi:rhodanese-related sulfurtransferase